MGRDWQPCRASPLDIVLSIQRQERWEIQFIMIDEVHASAFPINMG